MFYLWMEVGRHAFSPTPECSSFIISLYIFLIVCRLLVLAEHGTYWQPTFRSSFYLMCKVKLDSGPKYRLGFSFTIQIPTWICFEVQHGMGEKFYLFIEKFSGLESWQSVPCVNVSIVGGEIYIGLENTSPSRSPSTRASVSSPIKYVYSTELNKRTENKRSIVLSFDLRMII